MNNIAKVKNLAPLFGAKNRPATEISGAALASLKDEGVNFDGYTAQLNDVFSFPKYEDMVVMKQPVREGSTSYVFLLACERTRNGHTAPSYLNLNSLAKRDADNIPVMPEWYELGNVQARLQKLAEVGSVKATREVSIKAPRFDGDKRVYEQIMGEDGKLTSVAATRDQKVAILEAAK